MAQDYSQIKKVYYEGLRKQVSQLAGASEVYALDSSVLGDYPWFWNNAQIFNLDTYNWFANVFSYNSDGYLQSAGDSLNTGLFNTYRQLAYELSTADENAYNTANTANAAILNTVVTDYTTSVGPFPADATTAQQRLQIIYAAILSWGPDGYTLEDLRTALDPVRALVKAPIGTEQLINDFLAYLNKTQAVATIQNSIANFQREIADVGNNLQPAPSQAKPLVWMSATGVTGESKIVPYLDMSPSVAQIQNSLNPTSGGEQVSFSLSMTKQDSKTVKVSAGGSVGIGGIDFLVFSRVSGGASASYNSFDFDSSLTDATLKVTAPGVTKITPTLSASAFDASSGKGWWWPKIISEGVNNPKGSSGVHFTTPPTYNYGKNGTFGVLSQLWISQIPTLEFTYKTTDISKFDSVFTEESHWKVSFLGITLASGSQSYYKSVAKYDSQTQTVTLTMAPPAMSAPVNPLDQLAYVCGADVIWPGKPS